MTQVRGQADAGLSDTSRRWEGPIGLPAHLVLDRVHHGAPAKAPEKKWSTAPPIAEAADAGESRVASTRRSPKITLHLFSN
jgi:hypothetical protein